MSKRNKLKTKLNTWETKRGLIESPIWLAVGLAAGLLVSCDTNASEVNCDFLSELNPYQQEIAVISYRAGEPYDLGLTAVAIAWEESRLGKYKVRFNNNRIKDVSVGVMHTVAYWKTKNMNSFDSGLWVQDMIENDSKSISIGVQDMLHWQGVAKGDWKNGVGMYNGGYKPNYTYADKVVVTINKLKGCKF